MSSTLHVGFLSEVIFVFHLLYFFATVMAMEVGVSQHESTLSPKAACCVTMASVNLDSTTNFCNQGPHMSWSNLPH